MAEQGLTSMNFIPIADSVTKIDNFDDNYSIAILLYISRCEGEITMMEKVKGTTGKKTFTKLLRYYSILHLMCVLSGKMFHVLYETFPMAQRALHDFSVEGGTVGSLVILKEPRSDGRTMGNADGIVVKSDEPLRAFPFPLQVYVENSIKDFGTYTLPENDKSKCFIFHNAKITLVGPHFRPSACSNTKPMCNHNLLAQDKAQCACLSSARGSTGIVIQTAVKVLTSSGKILRDQCFMSWSFTKFLISGIESTDQGWEIYETHRLEAKAKMRAMIDFINDNLDGFTIVAWVKRGTKMEDNGKDKPTPVLSDEAHPHIVSIRPTNMVDPAVIEPLKFSLPPPSISTVLSQYIH